MYYKNIYKYHIYYYYMAIKEKENIESVFLVLVVGNEGRGERERKGDRKRNEN
jgi:hypothetical protein